MSETALRQLGGMRYNCASSPPMGTDSFSLPTSSSTPPFEAAPPSYDDSLQTAWQGPSTGGQSSNLPSAPRPALDPAQHALYSTLIPDNVEQPAYQERLVSGIEKTIITSGDVTRGNVVTHDPRLHDPAALEAFIKQEASIPPTLKILCTGHHLHQRHSQEMTRTDSGFAERNRSHNEIVVDFNFEIDLTSILDSTNHQRTLLTARPDRAVPRGTFHSTYHPDFQPYGPYYREHPLFKFFGKSSGDSSLERHAKSRATKPGIRPVRQERKLLREHINDRFTEGLPFWSPWPEKLVKDVQRVRDEVSKKSEARHLRSARRQAIRLNDGTAQYTRLGQTEDGYSPAAQTEPAQLEHATLLEWCEEFCRSSQPLKEFRLQKHVFGWQYRSLLVAIRAAIAATDYRGNVNVRFVQSRSLVTVHPDNHLTRWLTKKWVVVLLWLTLLYPFVWLYKRLFAGGEWAVANAAYPLKCYVPYDSNAPHVSSETREIRFGPSSDEANQSALFELSGYKEGRFMKRWESRIKHAVMRGAGTDGSGRAQGQPESLGDALLADREDAEGRQVTRALDGYESA